MLAAPVTISRDRWGVPHVSATSMEDAAFAMGVAHAQDRLWQMEVTRRVATGRISELIGLDGVNIDRFVRRVGLHRVARDEELRLGPEPRRMLKAYAAGVNGIASSRQVRSRSSSGSSARRPSRGSRCTASRR